MSKAQVQSNPLSTDSPFVRDELLNQPTTSARIRFLYSKGIQKKEIALILNIRYQHVRNVLMYELKKA
jgi:hypothetical protein